MSLFRKKAVSMSAVTYTMPAFTAPRGFSYEVQEVKDLGLAIEPIIGVREFRAYLEDPFVLYSINGAPWPQREPMQAFCGDDVFAEHDAPNEHCNCGIYAWKPEHNQTSMKLTGEIYMWGDVLVADYGYRSEFAYPKSLTIRTKPTRVTERLRAEFEDAYGVPVTIVEPEPMEPTPPTGPLPITMVTPAQYWQLQQAQLQPPQNKPFLGT